MRVERFETATHDLLAIASDVAYNGARLPPTARDAMLRDVPAIESDASDYLVAAHFLAARSPRRRKH